MSGALPSRREHWTLVGIFCAALIFQFYCTTLNWTSGMMPGHEFRQAQTAIVTYYIDKQNNFSLLYETPILGKPWVSILLEVPVYEWSVVGLSRATGLPHFMAARAVSLTCFYLALPAFFLLLGRLAIPRSRRLLVLALILVCPVYVFYSRAFLMESMELMCCAWFLLGFVRTMDGRRWAWLVLTIIAGVGAALIKSATLAVWLLPAAAYGAWLLWRDLRERRGWRAVLQTLLWGAATIAPALGALSWWVNLTDPLKAAHASAWIFTSKNLSEGNWGLLDFAARFSSRIWAILAQRWGEAIMPPWLVGLSLVAGVAAFWRLRWRILGLAAVFFLAQLMFPFAYAYQDYYYYACTVFLLAGFGLILLGVLESRLPRWACALVLLVPFAAEITTYWRGYRTGQVMVSPGGFDYTAALRDLAPKDSVIIVAGADWAAMIPLYSQHKALMIRNGLEQDARYLQRAFKDLAGEDVSALVLVGPQRENRDLLNFVAQHFDLDSSVPTFSQPASWADIYFRRSYIENVQARLRANAAKYPAVIISPKASDVKSANVPVAITAAQARSTFARVSPAPFQGYFAQGANSYLLNGEIVFGSHPDSDLWLHAPARANQINWDFGILPDAYTRNGDKTDGVEFIVTGETPDGNRRQIYRRVLDPVHQPADRGHQHEVIPYRPLPDETLIFSSRPYLSYSYDWAYWIRIEVK